MKLNPLFLPLYSKYQYDFISGLKTEELRQYGKRWNENTCIVDRKVVLSKGYGKFARAIGIITCFKKQNGNLFGHAYKKDIKNCFGTLDIEIACIKIEKIEILY